MARKEPPVPEVGGAGFAAAVQSNRSEREIGAGKRCRAVRGRPKAVARWDAYLWSGAADPRWYSYPIP